MEKKTIKKKVNTAIMPRTPIVSHGLMGGLSNFDVVASYFSERGYKIVIPDSTYLHANIKN
jgi:hypothetical protein